MLIVYDTETTGLVKHPNAPLAKQPRMIEFGAIALSLTTGRAMRKFKQLIKPDDFISEEISKITGITNDDLKSAPTFEEAWPIILAFLSNARMILAHNEPFDRAMVEFELARINKTFTWPQTYCTIGLYREFWGRDMKLIDLYSHVMGKEFDQKHRALSDVEALVEIVQKEKLWKVLA